MESPLNKPDHHVIGSFPAIMGVLNVTPDSFSDGGQFLAHGRAVQHAEQMIGAGACIIDVGGESTRPGAAEVTVAEELDRVIPVVEALVDATDVVVSVDTSKPDVMRAAIAAGAGLINDVRALRVDGAIEAVRDSSAMICLMHMQGQPRTMQSNPQYDDVCADIEAFLAARVRACLDAGIGRDRLIVDPGFGFGKSLQHNLQLLAGLDAFRSLGVPLLVGLSRKSMFGQLLGGANEQQRLHASVTAAVLAVQRGADIVRVHDVAATREALQVLSAVRQYE